jgi:DNA-binding beta-propeller fold protein YncE
MVALVVAIGLVSMACGGGRSSSVQSPPVADGSPSNPAQASSVPPSPTIEATPTIQPTPTKRFLVAQLEVDLPQGFATGFGSVWIPGHHSETITRIDAATNQVVAEIHGVGYQAQDVAVGAGSVWVPASGADFIARIDPATNKVASRLKVGAVSDVDFGFGSLWAATKDNRLLRIDPTTERVLATLQIGPKGPNDCNNTPVHTANWVWANVCDTGTLIRVDPGRNLIAQKIDIGAMLGSASGVATASGEGLWVVSTTEGCDGGESCVLARLDPDTGKVLRKYVIDPNRGSGFLALDGPTLWMGGPGIVTGFDAKSLKVTATYQATTYAEVEVGVGFGSLWATSYDLSQVLRFDLPAA